MTASLTMPDAQRLVRRTVGAVVRLHRVDRHTAARMVFRVVHNLAEESTDVRGWLHPWLRQVVEAAMDEEIRTRARMKAG